ncbi:Intermembrane transport protein PqiB [Candidatus Magnetaquicoccaceae bacterium FCR-1]|uniref:Intermembrane transport protein PqiB n=1 Tax=Candidatus Magnetaquiglobus chichijimensis TaxID=3141448 RepID=A0ABQ0CC53_9PROT
MSTPDSPRTPLSGTDAPSADAGIPLAVVETKRGNLQLVWLIPLVAMLVGAWLVYKTWSEAGPGVVLTFKSAEGIEAGKTRIKHKEVEVGVVDSVTLSPDFTHVRVHAALVKGTELFLNSGAKFWVVRPRLSLRGISGLGTLVSGVHIEMEPGQGESQREFVGLESPPPLRVGAPGTRYILEAPTLGSLEVGAPIYYRDIQVGEVLGYELNKDKKGITLSIFVQAPYNALVRDSTHFWETSGVDLVVDASGFRLRSSSVTRLLVGGITFDTPESLESGTFAAENTRFPLYKSESAVTEGSYTHKLIFVLYFKGSVRGLSVGAPVEFRGIQVGKVTDIRLEYDFQETLFRIPVLVQIEPERVIEFSTSGVKTIRDDSPREFLETLVKRGMRAQLKTGSYLTGQLFVELDLHPGAPLNLVGGTQNLHPELPTIPTSLDEITASVTRFLDKIQSLPLEGIGKELHETLKGTNRTVNAPETMETIRAATATLTEARNLLKNLNLQVEPMANGVKGASGAATATLQQLEETLTKVDGLIGPKAPLHYGMVEAVRELAAAARSVRSLIDLLERKPESLLFGKEKEGVRR